MKIFTADDNSEHPVNDAVDLGDESVRRNLNATVRVLAGVDVGALFGEIVPLDVVKITDWHPDTCDCSVQFLWRRDHLEDGRVHYPHRALRTCRHHVQHSDAAAHFTAVVAENASKNVALERAAQQFGATAGEFAWAFDEDRQLTLTHPSHGTIEASELKVT